MNTALNAVRREADLDYLASDPDDIDLIVIGGGITGVGIALDATSRGLNTVLLERRDFGFGTSRWSSKLAHGGLRYLTKLEVGIAMHSAKERGLLMEHNAPHLIRALPQVALLASDTNLVQKVAMRLGFIAGDMLRIAAGTSSKILPRSRYANKKETLQMCPTALQDNLRGSWVNYDGQMVDDARIVAAVARTAAGEGARILNYTEVTHAEGTAVEFHDAIGGRDLRVRAKAVINATGVWAGTVDEDIRVRPSRGTHLVVDAATLGNPTGALTVPLPGSISRYVFLVPQQYGRVFIGLTDEDTPGPIPDVPDTPEEDIDFILEAINHGLGTKLQRSDVIGAFTGLRPLIDTGAGGSTADLSRRHSTIEASNGLISIVGGKYTEFRLMAEEAIDEVLKRKGMRAGSCRTTNLPYVGAPTHPGSLRVNGADLAGLPNTMVQRYGYESPQVVATAPIERPMDKVAGLDITRAEVAFAVTHEGALNADDVLDRRTRIGLVQRDRDAAEQEVTEIVEQTLEYIKENQ
ncbi:glycerol-3-phosphate dehydrogenase/oxidase [Corynebacterium pelargi]|uniref:Glycerol-3-phosphate dehydrogenase n=1 Tax=Corynebacterium pelargi TaxID=1471400 RepID=A0A410WB09_9CORY|nr:glycerol-3-phosphate dehydrogenase/oxidase [Corynebacterium pelargi]QAU53120.1 Aerobic glycerol-3-phosphate dehydrogenase [Corynebacterium pelargi]GGG74762.1 glycerol-3-phosphate dehydrogenase 1 [Corynebacterium pelargi]